MQAVAYPAVPEALRLCLMGREGRAESTGQVEGGSQHHGLPRGPAPGATVGFTESFILLPACFSTMGAVISLDLNLSVPWFSRGLGLPLEPLIHPLHPPLAQEHRN